MSTMVRAKGLSGCVTEVTYEWVWLEFNYSMWKSITNTVLVFSCTDLWLLKFGLFAQIKCPKGLIQLVLGKNTTEISKQDRDSLQHYGINLFHTTLEIVTNSMPCLLCGALWEVLLQYLRTEPQRWSWRGCRMCTPSCTMLLVSYHHILGCGSSCTCMFGFYTSVLA